MKHRAIKAVAALLALLMLLGLAFAEETPVEQDEELSLGVSEDVEVIEIEIDSEPMEEMVVELEDFDLSLDTDTETPAETAIYRFIVDDGEYAVQEAQEGEAIVRPEDPATPSGKVFVGWLLWDGTQLFADGNDRVIVRKAELGTEVYAWAEFADIEQPAEEQSAEESAEEEPAEEFPAEEKPVEEPAEEEAAEESSAEEPAEESPVEEPAEEEPAEKEPAEEPAEEEPTEEEPAEEPTEEAAEEELIVEQPEDAPSAEKPVANALTYNGEVQPLVNSLSAWLYSTDGENYSEDIPTAVDAGEYTVYFKADADAEPETLVVTVAKADVTFIPPVAAFIED